MTQSDPGDPHVCAEQFQALFQSLTVWGHWGEGDERGALRHLTPERVAAAAGLVRDGHHRHAEPAAEHRAGVRQSPAGAPPHDRAGPGRTRGRWASLATTWASTTTATPTATSTRSATSPIGGPCTTAAPADSVTPRARRSARSRCSRTVSSGAACCSTSRAGAACAGSSRASTSARGPRGGRARPGGPRGRRRHPPGAHRPRPSPRRAGTWDAAHAKAGLHPTAMTFVAERQRRRPGQRRQQRHGAEQHRGRRLSHPRPGHQRDGRPPARLPPVRGSVRRL